MNPDPYEVALLVAGAVALLAAWVPAHRSGRLLSLPLLVVAVGVGVFLAPLGLPDFEPSQNLGLTERLTEVGVLVSLMGTGLKIDRPFGWSAWSSTIRMLAIGMPLSILGVAVLGWWMAGLSAASAVLLGAVMAPTDPVLASDVQVGAPAVGETADYDDEDEVRFTLTTEAGLNDALAFPFVYLAIRLADDGWSGSMLAEWLAVDVVYRLAIGLAVGLGVGWLIGRISFDPPGKLRALAETRQGFVAVAAMFLAFGAAEVIGGYGFLAVFVCAVAIRSSERSHEFHGHLHDFVEQSENLLVVGLLVLLGGALAGGVLSELTWEAAGVALLLVLVVRPVAGSIALVKTPLDRVERGVVAAFGIRGIGSLYYLSYALGGHPFDGADLLWATVVFAILASIVVHGLAATPAMSALDRAQEGTDEGRAPSG